MDSLILVYQGQSEFVAKPASFKEAVETTIDVFRLDCKPSAVELFMDIKGRHVHVGERGYSCIPPLQEVFVRVGISQQQQPSSTHSNHLPQSRRSPSLEYKPEVKPSPLSVSRKTSSAALSLSSQPISPAPRRRPSTSDILFSQSQASSDLPISSTALPSPPLTPPSSSSSNSSAQGDATSSSRPRHVTKRRHSVRFVETATTSKPPISASGGPRRWPSVDAFPSLHHPPLVLPSGPSKSAEPQTRRRSASDVEMPGELRKHMHIRRSYTTPDGYASPFTDPRLHAGISPPHRPDSPMPLNKAAAC